MPFKATKKKIQMRIKKSVILKICKNYVLLCNKFFAKMGTQLFYSLIKIFFFRLCQVPTMVPSATITLINKSYNYDHGISLKILSLRYYLMRVDTFFFQRFVCFNTNSKATVDLFKATRSHDPLRLITCILEKLSIQNLNQI